MSIAQDSHSCSFSPHSHGNIVFQKFIIYNGADNNVCMNTGKENISLDVTGG